jgi:cell shape-determining protein MreD
MLSKLLTIAYVVIGFFVASAHHYFRHLSAFKPIASAILGVALWPLILFGVNLHLH